MNRVPCFLTVGLLALPFALPTTATFAACCVGTTGNVDGSSDCMVDISDVFAMVDYLSASIPLSSCSAENDVNIDGTADISDLFALIDYLAGAAALPTCPFETGTVADVDGNVYQTVTIGTQVWMAENLRVTHYRNGDPIPNVTDPNVWDGLTAGAYCEYYNDVNNVPTYGRLYNWHSVSDVRNIAPAGWHIPSNSEWEMLAHYDCSYPLAGGKMKEVGTTHWQSPNMGATNESGFTGLPGGVRILRFGLYMGYLSMGASSSFWSSTEAGSGYAWYQYLSYNNSYFVSSGFGDRVSGFSVRCVKD